MTHSRTTFLRQAIGGPMRIVARFGHPADAEAACAAINELLDDAREETEALLERQGGAADIADVQRIYARFGLSNETGWAQDRPLEVSGQDLVWDAPVGLEPADAEAVLWAFGAAEVLVHEERDEPWRESVPFPMLGALDEEEFDWWDQDDDEPLSIAPSDKKLLH